MLIQEFMMYIVDKGYKREERGGIVDLVKVEGNYPYSYSYSKITDEAVSILREEFLKTKGYYSPLPFKIAKHGNPD